MSANETAEAILIVLKKIGKWLAVAVAALLLIYLAFYAYVKIEDHYENRPKLITSLNGIELGERFQDFMFRNAGFALDEDRKTDIVYFRNKEKSTTVAIADNKVARILYACKEEYDYKSVNGIDCRSSGDDVFRKYDKEIRVQCLKDKSDSNYMNYRVYEAIKYGVRYHVVSNEVVAFDVVGSNELENTDGFINKNWSVCQ
jgi:hypothetical protein